MLQLDPLKGVRWLCCVLGGLSSDCNGHQTVLCVLTCQGYAGAIGETLAKCEGAAQADAPHAPPHSAGQTVYPSWGYHMS